MIAPDWSTACLDWETRIVERRSLLPCEPLFPVEAAEALEVMRALRLVDVAGEPTIGEACLPWALDLPRALFGAYDREAGRQLIRYFFLLVSKKNTKSTLAAGIMLTALIRNWRRDAEFLIIAPTLEVASNSFKPAASAIAADDELSQLLHFSEHHRTITHRTTGAALKVVAADKDTVTGKKATGVLIDELWLFGKRSHADAMLREVTGGLVSRPEGFVIYLSTQSDEPPAGVFKNRLHYFRDVRDGVIADPKSLPIIYEFPPAMIDAKQQFEAANWYITNPNLGVSVDHEWLVDEYRKAELAGDDEFIVHCSKHLNLEIGLALRNDGWVGAKYWMDQADPELDLDRLIERSEVIVAGVDGGGLYDLLGLAIMGRDKQTRDWLLWCHAWAQDDVFARGNAELEDFVAAGQLTRCETPTQDIEELVAVLARIKEARLFPDKQAIGLDPAGVAALVDEAIAAGITDEQLIGVAQGFRLSSAVWGMERKLKDGTLWHGGQELMTWVVGNARIEQRGNAVLITKQAAGKAKIDPLIAAFNAVMLMSRNPGRKWIDVSTMVA